MVKRLILLLFVFECTHLHSFAQNIGINDNGAAPNAAAIVDISASTNNKGVLLPRVTNAQMIAITGTVSTGMILYNTTENMFYYNRSTTTSSDWIPFLSTTVSTSTGLAAWSLTGNSSLNAANNFVGTTDAKDLYVKTNAAERIRFNTAGQVGVNVSSNPAYQLTIGTTGTTAFGVDNTATLMAKNSGGAYEPFMWPRWSDNAMYMNYGSAGLNIRNNSLTNTMFILPTGEVGIGKTSGMAEKLDVVGNIKASGTVYYGNSAQRTEWRDDAGLGTANSVKSGFYETAAPSPSADWPQTTASFSAGFDGSGNAQSWWHMIDIRHVHNNNYALQISGSFFDQFLYYRKTGSVATTPWTRVLTYDDLPTYGITRVTFANPGAGTYQFYDGTINVRLSAGAVQYSSDASGTWDIYTFQEKTQGDTDPSTWVGGIASTGAADWKTIFSFASNASTVNGPGGTIWFSKADNNTSATFEVVILRHGTYCTALIRTF